MRHTHPPARESGQAAVEAALIVPMMVFLMLGIIQLGMMQQARIMTEYAAYRAVRSGIVNHGSCKLMRQAAIVAVLPTLGPPVWNPLGVKGRTDNLVDALKLYHMYTKLGTDMDPHYPLGFAPPKMVPIVKVDVLNPKKSQLTGLFNSYGVWSATKNRTYKEEIDYDDVRNDTVINANLLTLRLTYHYNMRVPFANKMIHAWFMAAEWIRYAHGVTFDNKTVMGVSESTALETKGAGRGGYYPQFALLAKGWNGKQMFLIPFTATYSMRMQSNMMKKHIETCAVDG